MIQENNGLAAPPILEMKLITKRFPGVLALDKVNFCVHKGEIHALIGQNGAGKSTLMKVLAGIYSPTDGSILIDGEPVVFRHPRQALNLNIAIVYQELSLLPNLSVAKNIFLGREIRNIFGIDDRKINDEAKKVLSVLGVDNIDVTEKVENIPIAQRQLVEIARAISYHPRILILDEPTATLSPEDTERMFAVLNRLKEQDIAIIYISHRLKEITSHCDRGTILRNGKVVQTQNIKGTSEEEIIELMIGQKKDAFFHVSALEDAISEEVLLEVENLSVPGKVQGVTFQLHKGEIIGLTGLLGAGQNEVARALFGEQQAATGTIKKNEQTVNITSPQKAFDLGICLLTENRKEEGLFLDMSVKENITMPSIKRFVWSSWFPFLSVSQEKKSVKEIIKKVNVVARSQDVRIRTLSGGNQQKAILGRWLLLTPDIFVFIEPTRGIDVGAKAEIYRHLDLLAKEGKGIIVVSPDLIEILGIADRILVMHGGRLVKEMPSSEATEELILAAIQGTVIAEIDER